MQFKRTYAPAVSPLEGWQKQAACGSEDPELFFAPEGERKAARQIREAAARAVCDRCRVRRECLSDALATFSPYGMWGGLSEAERQEAADDEAVAS